MKSSIDLGRFMAMLTDHAHQSVYIARDGSLRKLQGK